LRIVKLSLPSRKAAAARPVKAAKMLKAREAANDRLALAEAA